MNMIEIYKRNLSSDFNRSKIRRCLFASLFFVISSFYAFGQNSSPAVSGFYETLLLGVDAKSKILTGYFEEKGGWNEQTKTYLFDCAFYIYGTPGGDFYRVTTWYPGDGEYIKGELRFAKDGKPAVVDLKLDAEHGGCQNVHPFSTNVELSFFPLEERGEWNSVRVVAAKKSYFYNQPDANARGKSYVIRFNVVRVGKSENGWVEAEFGEGKRARGWIRESDLFAAEPR